MSIRSKNKTSAAIAAQNKHSIMVIRSNKHFEAQIISPAGIVIGGATTKSNDAKKQLKQTGNCDAARTLAQSIAKLLNKLDIKQVAFNRSGYIYHGRISAFVDGLRAAGVKI